AASTVTTGRRAARQCFFIEKALSISPDSASTKEKAVSGFPKPLLQEKKHCRNFPTVLLQRNNCCRDSRKHFYEQKSVVGASDNSPPCEKQLLSAVQTVQTNEKCGLSR
ncbi:MAG: hypothetical protein ACTTJK_04860, partial [Phocaeicola sp.]|uniref:hypothetical protein n=1 Tax=Phocaeicola sp. TaxID=2773926 RepID=UPI003FA15DF2